MTFYTMSLETRKDSTTEETENTNLLSSLASFNTSQADIVSTTCKAKEID